ncbi:MAG: phosphoglucomutase/phosphomannomutase family protein [Elusimicrobia bacterium]|nr:phosphoglucomutase/phosphomannomutase family protein [Elusimicrobiota bacterium]
MPIHFGTSGWRAVFAEEFTFANVRKLSAAIAAHVKEHAEFGAEATDYRALVGQAPPLPLVVIGYDTRFLSESFAREAAEVFAAHSIRVLLATADVPTPALAHAVLAHKAVGGVVITASHNPAKYNGYKWTPYWGGPATPPVTDDIERRVSNLAHTNVTAMPAERAEREGWIVAQDFRPAYFKQLASLLHVPKLKSSKLKIGIDALGGAVRGYLRPFCQQVGLQCEGLHEERDVLFGGESTEPAPERLVELTALVKKKGLHLGVACDGDGDRFGIVDAGGTYIPANDVLALAVDHLVRNRGLRGKVARSLMTSHFVDAVAKSHGLEVRETPVGFKFIGEFLRGGQFLFGGEESGGLSIQGHVPEKDGLLACLLMAELVAFDRKPLAKIREQLYKKVGTFFNERRNYHLDRPSLVSDLEDRLRTKPPLAIAGTSVWRINQTDGFKFIMKDGSWVGLRASGTEPVVRLYAEASTDKRLEALLAAAEKIITGKA